MRHIRLAMASVLALGAFGALVIAAQAQSPTQEATTPTAAETPPAGDGTATEAPSDDATPTEAEQSLLVPGLRAGHYLCFFGMHVFTPAVMDLLDAAVERAAEGERVELSPLLAEVARQERYLALQVEGRRYPLDVGYGLLTAQLALALSGRDRETVLAGLCEMLAQDHLDRDQDRPA